MITKIAKIADFAVFQNFEWDSSVKGTKGVLTFKKVNILYGQNYSGKTTLSRIFRAFETRSMPDKYENPTFVVKTENDTFTEKDIGTADLEIRVFNDDFIKSNLSFLNNPDGEINAFAIIGADNVRIQKQIEEAKMELGRDDAGFETGLYKLYADACKQHTDVQTKFSREHDAFEKALTNKASGNRDTSIKYEPKYGDQNYNISKLKSEIQIVLNEDFVPIDNTKKTELELFVQEKPMENVSSLDFPKFDFPYILTDAKNLLFEQVEATGKLKELILDAALSQWVEKGIELNKERNCCAFCGNPISQARWKEIYEHFDERSENIKQKINALIVQIEQEKRKVKTFQLNISLFYLQYREAISKLMTEYALSAEEYSTVLDKIKSSLEEKKYKLTETRALDITDDCFQNLIRIYKQLEEIRIKNNASTASLKKQQTEARRLLRLREVSDFITISDYIKREQTISELKDRIDSIKDTVKDFYDRIKTKREEIDALTRQLNDEEAGARKVNEYLSCYFGHGTLQLRAETLTDDKSIIFRVYRNDKPAYNLSNGECSLIAFCYFVAKLDDTNTQEKKPIIWIDDPISSLDADHVFFVYSILREKIYENSNFTQLFISTHNLNFLKYLNRLTGDDRERKVEYFFIKKINENTSTMQAMPEYLKRNVTEFNYLFEEIYRCSKVESINDENYKLFYNFGNNARKFLEILMFYSYPNKQNQLKKLERFFDGRIPALVSDRINNEYSHLSSALERGGTVMEVPEMLKTAKLIIATLERKNPDQFSALVESIEENRSELSTTN